jgi:hypothetical protein
MFGLSFLELAEVGLFVWVLDSNGNRHKVKVRSEEHRQKLLAQNRKMRAELKKKNKPIIKKRVVRKKKKSEWDW